MANDSTNTTTNFDIEYPENGYDATPTWAELYGAAFEDIDSALAERLVEEEVEDVVGALLAGGDKVGVSYDDANDTLTIDTSALDAEEVRDEVGSLLVGGDGITVTVDDAGDSVTIALANHASTHEKGGSDELTTFGDTEHDSVSTGKATINETQDTRPDADVQVQQTGMDPRLGATQPPVGSRQLVHFDQIVQSDTAVTNSSPQNYGAVYRFGYLNTFPNVVPSLHALIHVGNATDGEETVVTLTNPEGNANYLEFSPSSGTGDFVFHKQTYLDSEDFGTAAGRSNLPGGGIAVEAYSTNSSDGTLYADSNWWLEYEVV